MRYAVARSAMVLGLVATGISIVTGVSVGQSPSIGWFAAGLGLFFGGKLLLGRPPS